MSGFHLLESTTVNETDLGAEAKGNTHWKAPPTETRVIELTQWTGVAMELERHLRLVRTRSNGDDAFVRADATMCDAINNRLGRSGSQDRQGGADAADRAAKSRRGVRIGHG